MLRLLIPFMLCCSLAAFAEEDHEAARAAVERGELLPLSRILVIVGHEFPGSVLEVELEREKGRYIYEFEILQANGDVIEVQYDGRTAQRLKVEREDD
ncbi:MAG: PepSY domain-containing protein [Steroidobacteraceae bacterium]